MKYSSNISTVKRCCILVSVTWHNEYEWRLRYYVYL